MLIFLSAIFSAIFDEKSEIRERCKGVLCVDLGESFPTRIYLQKSASIQPRTSPSKFEGKFNSLFTSLLRREPRRLRRAGLHRRPRLLRPGRRFLPALFRSAAVRPRGPANFTWLVLGCIEADFCNQIFVWKLSPRYTWCTPLYSSPISFSSESHRKCYNSPRFTTHYRMFA